MLIEEITNDIDKSMVPKFLFHTKNKTRNNTFLSKPNKICLLLLLFQHYCQKQLPINSYRAQPTALNASQMSSFLIFGAPRTPTVSYFHPCVSGHCHHVDNEETVDHQYEALALLTTVS